MPKFFKKKKRNKLPAKKKDEIPDEYKIKGEIVDPIEYSGDLDAATYPVLDREVDSKPQEEVENPLNKR